MTPKKQTPEKEERTIQNLEEICENTRAIRRVVNRILDHLHEYQTGVSSHEDTLYSEPDEISWDDLDDDMYL